MIAKFVYVTLKHKSGKTTYYFKNRYRLYLTFEGKTCWCVTVNFYKYMKLVIINYVQCR